MQTVQGETKTITTTFNSKATRNRLDLTSVQEIRYCVVNGGNVVYKIYLPTTGNTVINVPTITSIPSTADLFVGCPISGPGIPSGAKVLSIDSSTQVTMTLDGINSVNATSTNTAADYLFGDVEILTPTVLGQASLTLQTADTTALGQGDASIEAKVVIGGVTKYVLFKEPLSILAPYC